jgi:hypothetical protein
MLRRILVLDGGGLKGIIPAIVCEAIERVVGKPIHQIFDLITGTSTGAVIGGCLAAGVPAETIRKLYIEEVPKFFTPRIPIIPFLGTFISGSKYDRKDFVEALKKYTNNCTLGEVKTDFLVTAFNLCSGRTHFIRNSDPLDAAYKLWEVISWSALSAVAYFGKINVPDFQWDYYLPEGSKIPQTGAVFQDGGQGTQNSTVGVATVEAVAKKWFDEGTKDEVFMLSLGCGQVSTLIPYGQAVKTGSIGQIVDFISQARDEATINQQLAAKYIAKGRTGFQVFRVDAPLTKTINLLDGKKFIDQYKSLGEQIKNMVPFDLLK